MTTDLNLGDTQLIIDECNSYGCSTYQTAYILATGKWETAHTMKPVQEAYWLSDKWRQENLRYYPWHGRGYVQLTWERNYKFAGEKLGLDLTSDPTIVMKPDVAAKILVRGMMEGWFTSRKLVDYVSDNSVDFVNARRVVNGTDKAQEIADLAKDYVEVLRKQPSKPKEPERVGWGAIIISLISSLLTLLRGGRK